MTTRPHEWMTKAALATGLALFCLGATAQVSVMNRVPTQQELRDALQPPKQSKPASKPDSRVPGERTRQIDGISWDEKGVSPTPAPQSPSAGSPAGEPPAPAVALPIQFDVNSARVSGTSVGYVEAIAQLLASEPQLRLTVEGHTDSTGDARRNLLLSWDRALSVYRSLIERYGVEPARLQPVGRGSAEPLDGMQPTAPVNRRVQFRRIG
jgi:outer membrane protein OmpA-like peptidoglycan-associated protein